MVGGISFGGVISGLDTNAIIDAFVQFRRQPISALERQAELVHFERQAYQRVNTRVLSLQDTTLALRYESTYRSKSVTSSNNALFSATAGFTALNRSYSIEIDQVAKGARAISGLNDRSLDRSAASLIAGNTAGISGLTASGTSLGSVRATLSTNISETRQAGVGSAQITAGDTIAIAGTLKDGVTDVNGIFTFAGDSTDTLQRLGQTIESTFQGEVNFSIGRNGEIVLTEADTSIAGSIALSSLTFNDTDFSGSTLTIGTGNSYAGGTAVANVVTGTRTFTTGSTAIIATSATTIQSLDQVTGTLDSGLDAIDITGTDYDGSAISGTYTFTAGDTLNELLTAINGLYSGVTATIQNGRIVLTDTATGSSQTSMALTYNDNTTTTNTFNLGLFSTAVVGTASSAQAVNTSAFNVAARGKHIVSVTDGLGGQLTGTVSVDPDTLLTSLGITEPHLLSIDVDSGASGVEPVSIRGLSISSSVQDFIEAVNTEVPGVTAGLTPDGSGQYYVQLTSNNGGTDIRVLDSSTNGILENLFNPTGGVDTDYTTANATTDTTDFTMFSTYTPSNYSGTQRYIYTGAEGTGVTSVIENFSIDGGALDVFDPGVAIVYTVEDSKLNLQPATDSHIIGAAGVSDPTNTSHPPLNIFAVLSQAGFNTTPENEEDNSFFHTDGFFAINGVQITIDDIDSVTVNDVIGLINSSGAGVVAEYDATQDRFMLRRNDPGNTSPITLGGQGDTSNFLTITQLVNNDASSFAGREAGSISLDSTLNLAGFTLPPSAGTFTINGVILYVDPTTDTLEDLIEKINNSAAGVEAVYDSAQDKIVLSQVLSENPTFDQITIGALTDTSNILSSFRLTNSVNIATTIGTTREKALFSVDGVDYTRNTNSIDDVISDVVLALKGVTTNPESLTIAQDTDAGMDAIVDFVASYNQLVETINPMPLSTEEKDNMDPLSDSDMARMTLAEIDDYENEREELIQRDFIIRSSINRRLNTTLRSSVFNPVLGITSGRLDRIATMGISTGPVGSLAFSATEIPYLVEDSTNKDAIRARIESSTSVKTYILEKADEMLDLFSKEVESTARVTGTLDISSGVVLENDLRFRIGDGTTYGNIELLTGTHTQSDILSAINEGLNLAGLIGIISVGITPQGRLELEAQVETGRARIDIIDLNAGAQLDDTIGLLSGSTYGEYATSNAGLARRVDAELENYTGLGGFIHHRISFGGSLDRRLRTIAGSISDLEDRLAEYEIRLRRRYAYLETALARFQSTSQFLANYSAQLTTGTTSSTTT